MTILTAAGGVGLTLIGSGIVIYLITTKQDYPNKYHLRLSYVMMIIGLFILYYSGFTSI